MKANQPLPLLLSSPGLGKTGNFKSAGDEDNQFQLYKDKLPGDDSNREALNQIARLGLISLGIGAGARSLVGLKDLLNRPFKRRKLRTTPAVIEVGVPEEKYAADNSAPEYYIPPDRKILLPEKPSWADRLLGRLSVDYGGKPWFWTAALGAPALGLYGGYKGVDKLLDWMNKKDSESELEQAKREYRDALLSQYSLNKKSEDLSDIFAKYEKRSDWNNFFGDMTARGLNYYLPIATALALLSGTATYNWAKSRAPEERLSKAIKQRERLRWATRPPEMYAVTKPVQTESPQYIKATPEDEEEVEKYSSAQPEYVSKIASFYKP